MIKELAEKIWFKEEREELIELRRRIVIIKTENKMLNRKLGQARLAIGIGASDSWNSTFSRSRIANMTRKEFAKYEKQIDEDLADGKTFQSKKRPSHRGTLK